MRKQSDAEDVLKLGCSLFVLAGVLLLGFGIWVGRSHFEARAYNHVTGKNVSTWDAMFLDLRVQAEPKE